MNNKPKFGSFEDRIDTMEHEIRVGKGVTQLFKERETQAVFKSDQTHLMIVKKIKSDKISVALHNVHCSERPFKTFSLTPVEFQERLDKCHYEVWLTQNHFTDVMVKDLSRLDIQVSWRKL